MESRVYGPNDFFPSKVTILFDKLESKMEG